MNILRFKRACNIYFARRRYFKSKEYLDSVKIVVCPDCHQTHHINIEEYDSDNRCGCLMERE